MQKRWREGTQRRVEHRDHPSALLGTPSAAHLFVDHRPSTSREVYELRKVTRRTLNAVGHLAQRHGKRDVCRLEGHRKRLRVLNNEAGVDGLVALESGEVTRRGMGAPEMKPARCR